MRELLMLGMVMLGGSLGAGARYGCNQLIGRLLGAGFPFSTLFVNVIGSFLMGIIVAYLLAREGQSEMMKLFLTTGFLGAFTTFSTFSLDFMLLLERKALLEAGLYLFLSVSLAILFLILGYWLGKVIA